MQTNQNISGPDEGQDPKKESSYSKSNAPTITLPKGGGAIKPIDEKFSVNAANGTAGFSIPFLSLLHEMVLCRAWLWVTIQEAATEFLD